MTRHLAPLLAIVALAVASAGAQSPSAGTGTIFVGSYSGHLTAVDEATGTATKIPLKTGAPFVVRLSPDRSRFYVQSANQERFEVVDVRTRQSVDTFTLSDARRHVRALAFEVDPQHRTMVIVAHASTRLIDRWEIGPPEFILYDLVEHKVTRTVPWPIDPEPTQSRRLPPILAGWQTAVRLRREGRNFQRRHDGAGRHLGPVFAGRVGDGPLRSGPVG